MPKLSYNVLSNAKTLLADDIEAVARAGIPGMTIHTSKVDEQNVGPLKRQLRDAGVEVASYASGGRFLIPGRREYYIEETKRRIEVCADLGAGCLVLVTGGPRASLDWHEAERNFLSALDEVLPVAEAHNLPLGVEPVTHIAQQISYLHALDEGVELVRKVNSPYLGLVVDVWYHWWQRNFMDQVRLAGDKMLIVQIADQKPDGMSMQGRTILGRGVLPLEEIVSAIDDTGYDGYYDAEIFNDTLTEAELDELIPSSKSFFDRLWGALPPK